MSDAAAPAQSPDWSERSEAELRKILGTKTSFYSAFLQGAMLAAKTAQSGLVLAVLFALVGGLGGYACIGLADQAAALDDGTRDLLTQGGVGLSVFLLLYTAVQFTKRETASRASWAPSLLAAPVVLMTGGMMLIGSGQAAQLGPVVISLFLMPFTLLWASFGGAATAIGWVRAGHGELTGKPVPVGEVFSEVGRRVLEVAGPHGGRVHAVTIGMQVLVPGIFYWLQLAFTDMVAVLEPERPALRRSGALTWGMRGRLFRLALLWFVGTQLLAFGIATLVEGSTEPVGASFIDPGALSLGAFMAVEFVWALTVWVLELSLLVLYVERERQVAAKRELRKREQPGDNAWAPPATETPAT